jgi:hypothetical protein
MKQSLAFWTAAAVAVFLAGMANSFGFNRRLLAVFLRRF